MNGQHILVTCFLLCFVQFPLGAAICGDLLMRSSVPYHNSQSNKPLRSCKPKWQEDPTLAIFEDVDGGFDHVCRGSHPGLSPLRWAKIQINLTKKYVNIPSEKYIYVHKYVYICVYTYLCKMDEYRSYNGLS